MTFTPKNWENSPSTATPINEEALEDVETRLSDYTDAQVAAEAAARTAADGALAPLASPALTGNPTAPTQTAGNNTTRLATTAFVTTAVAAAGGGGGGGALSWTAFTYGTWWATPATDPYRNFTGDYNTIQGGRYAKDVNGVVYLDGMVSPTTDVIIGHGQPTSLITTLPVGFRPAAFKRFLALGYQGAYNWFYGFTVDVKPTGEVLLTGYPIYQNSADTDGYAPDLSTQLNLTLDGLCFPTN